MGLLSNRHGVVADVVSPGKSARKVSEYMVEGSVIRSVSESDSANVCNSSDAVRLSRGMDEHGHKLLGVQVSRTRVDLLEAVLVVSWSTE